MSRLTSTACTPFALHVVEQAADELGLRLEDVDDRGDPVGVRAVEGEQVRVPRYDGAQVGLRPVAPVVAQSASVRAVHVEAAQVVGGVKAGAVDDGVDHVLDTVGGAQTAFGELDDGRGLQRDVGQRERRKPRARLQGSLAADGVVRRQLCAQVRVGNLAVSGTRGPCPSGPWSSPNRPRNRRSRRPRTPHRGPSAPRRGRVRRVPAVRA